MANISITKHESLTVEIFAEDSFPDALDQACSEAVRGMRDTLRDVCGAEARDDMPPAV